MLLINGRFTTFWIYINGRFIGLLLLGMLISYFSVSLLLDLALQHYPLLVWSSFFGMIIGSIYYIARDYDAWSRKNLLFLILGSFLLILFGNYVLLLVDSVNALYLTMVDLVTLDFAFMNNAERMRLLKVLGVFMLGSITGLITLSHFLGYLLRSFKNATNAVIIGFITGSLGVVWPWKNEMYQLDSTGSVMMDQNGNPILQENKHMRRFGLIGRNIDYSFSRSYFTQKFDLLGINAKYQNFDCTAVKEVLEILQDTSIDGYNVTIPFKEQVFSFLDSVDTSAEKIGAINTIKRFKNGKLKGFNTDFLGFTGALYEKLGIYYKPNDLLKPLSLFNNQHDFLKDCKALVLGTGGASKAIVYALHNLGITSTLVSRKHHDSVNQLVYAEVDEAIIQDHNLIINTTPLGTYPEINTCPDLPYGLLTKNHFLFDLVYNPSETQFLKHGKEQGTIISNGLRMLELQAEFAWELWNA